jgi:hypothetical protein
MGIAMSDTSAAGASATTPSRFINVRIAPTALGVLTVLAPFLAILCLGVPSWFPTAVALDTMTAVDPGAPWNDPAWSIAGRLLWSVLLAVGFVALLNLRGWWGKWLPPALLLAGLAIPQACIWATGQSKYTAIGGLLPFSDASIYLDYAKQMLENHRIVSGFADRPMFAAMLSSIFQFTGPNLKPALALLLVFCGGGMFLAAREMYDRFGGLVAACFLSIIYVFYNRSIGTLMTEHLGLALGLYALALLLRGLMEPRRGAWFIGMFLLSAALCARAGAFFVLPPLCLVTGRLFRKSGRFSPRIFTLAIAVVLVPFVLNSMLFVRLFDPATRPKSNFSYVAYGALRGTNWTDAMNTFGADHEKIRAATLELIRKKPHRILLAVRRTGLAFFWDSYGFIFMGLEWSRVLICAFLFAFALGFARSSRSPYDGFCIAIGGGILASIPFVPPVDCDYMRAYAATIPLQACLAASGIGALVRLIAPAFRRTHSEPVRLIETRAIPSNTTPLATSSATLIMVLVFLIPLGRSLLIPAVARYKYLTGRNPSEFPPGLAIHLVSDEVQRTRVPDVRISDFRTHLGGLGAGFQKEAAWLASLPAGTSIIAAGTNAVIVLPSGKLHRKDSHAEFETTVIGYLVRSVDRELSIPDSENEPAPPPDGKAEPR